MKLSKKIPRWYHCDSTFNTKKAAQERVSELRKEAKGLKQTINVRLKKRNARFFSVFVYSPPTQQPKE